MAVYACNTYLDSNPTGSCQHITLNAWAKLDSANAVPWLLLAGKAQAKKDDSAVAVAFKQAAKATRTDAYNFSLYSYSELEMPGDVTPLERRDLATQVIGVEAAMASFHYRVAAQYCSAAASEDAVRQECAALAELFVRQGTNFLDLSIGARLGARAGWSQERVAGLAEERDALMQAAMQAYAGGSEELWSCEAVHRGNAYMAEWARLGELGAARELLDQSGESVSALAQKQREFMDKILLNAQQRQPAAPAESAP